MSTIAKLIVELQAMPAAQLARRYTDLFDKEPRVRNRSWLIRQCAWRLQERELGGLTSHAKCRLDELVARIDLPLREAVATRARQPAKPVRDDPNTPMVGTVITREYRGQQLRLLVRENGFELNGIVYRSLSAAAKAVTGATWNGRLFFGLTERRAAQ